MRRRGERRRSQHGYATIWGIGWMMCSLLIGWFVLLIAVAVARQHHLDGAADLSALSAAGARERGEAACTAAQHVANANDAHLADCALDGDDVTVAVQDSLDLPLGLHLHLESRARAGPG